MLNEALNVVAALDFEQVGEVVMLKELLADGDRALCIANADEERVVRLAEPLRDGRCAPVTTCCSTRGPATSTRRCPKSEVEELVLEEVPDIAYERIGGLKARSSQIRDAVELPTCTPSCSRSTS